MKKTCFLMFLIAPLLAWGQEDYEVVEPKRNIFKVSPQHFAINTLKVGLERFNKSKNRSISLFVSAQVESNKINRYDDRYSGLGGELQYRSYIRPIAIYKTRKNRSLHQGIYFSGDVHASTYSGDRQYWGYYFDPNTNVPTYYQYDYSESIGNWGGGFSIGIQKVFWDVLYIDVFVGGGIQWADIIRIDKPSQSVNPNLYNDYYDITDPGYQGILPKIGVHIGIGL